MLYHSPIFVLFFTIFFVLYSFVFLERRPRILLILVASLIFYAGWNYRFIPLLVLSAVIDYFAAILIHRSGDPLRRKLYVSLSVATNLGVLAVFKYAGFALQSIADLLAALGIDASVPMMNLVLPVGISFYTFQSMSYTIDVYRGKMEPRRGLVQFTAALAFFPQLIAGPILRARQILPQFEHIPVPNWPDVRHGFVLITIGLFKKTVADLLGTIVDPVFGAGPHGALETWAGVLAFAGQIYGDFSGYTDMSIGIALLLGFKLPGNFNLPYFATSPVEFWRRWHTSLSTWLRDYLYISLGGNRGHRTRNVFITMVLGGLWHGAAWTFVAWGAFHAVLIVVSHRVSSTDLVRGMRETHFRLTTAVAWLVTFYTVLVGWVLFRAETIASAAEILSRMHCLTTMPASPENAVRFLVLAGVALLTMHLFDFIVIRWGPDVERRAWLMWPALFALQLVCFFLGEPDNAFIYFQF